MDWSKGNQLNDSDKILTAIGISRLILQIGTSLAIYNVFFFHVNLQLNTHSTITLIGLVDMFCNYASIWLTTFLSVFYFFKIANFNHFLFEFGRKKISQRLETLMVGCIILALLNTLLFLSPSDMNSTSMNSTQHVNITSNCEKTATFVFLFVLANCLPLIIYVFSSVLLVHYLYLHISQKRNGDQTFSSPNLDKFQNTIKSMIFLFFIFADHVVVNFTVAMYCFKVNIMWIQFLKNLFPTLHSLFLILKTSKLSQQLHKLLHPITKCFSGETDLEIKNP
ncbi:hypothetical protein GDO86_010631 [Hymenochirus boettgeri]|uniref:Taste receptor type 2 n=1 Tax=Hymenochirus boettgeri TaxID=247094 RepID=A0A8T2JRA0_9PIPI|nr:hypothetical protein GDO86_010631 [Hymenochirus boettgeri]